jgi:SAM-dependent methyltransferase
VNGTEGDDATDVHVLTSVTITDEGLALRGEGDFPIDVMFDDRRIFSFWLQRDTEARGGDVVHPWPPVLTRFLDGTTELTLVDHVSGTPLHVETVRLGSGSGRIAVEDAQGNPMGLDKSMRLSRLFTSRSAEHLEPLLDAIGSVLGALEEAGVKPFLAYGTLLGAVRDGTFIGHDSDADLAYVSAHEHPVDAVLESFRLHRRLLAMGYEIVRHSGLAFKVIVRESDGSPRGLDVFGGLMRDGTLYLMGEVGHPFSRDWLEPRSEVTLAGRVFPAPRAPEHLLEAMYGPGWRVPDPAYKFETPRTARLRLTGWFRGTRVGLDARWERFQRTGGHVPDREPSELVKWMLEREPEVRTAVDVGCGSGRDVLWLARRGVESWGLDYFPRDFRGADRRAVKKGLPASFEWMNLDELRSVLVMGATLSRKPGPRVVLARHVLEATDGTGRENLLRLAKMVTRGSGRLYLQMRSSDPESRRAGLPPLALGRFRAQVEGLGGTVLEEQDLDQHEQPVAGPTSAPTPFSRWVVTWDR